MILVQSELPGLIAGPFEVREYFAIFTQHDRYVLSDFLPNHRIMSLANPSSPKRRIQHPPTPPVACNDHLCNSKQGVKLLLREPCLGAFRFLCRRDFVIPGLCNALVALDA